MGTIEIHNGSILYFIGEKYKDSSSFQIMEPKPKKQRGSKAVRCNSKYYSNRVICNALLIHNKFVKDLVPYFVTFSEAYEWK